MLIKSEEEIEKNVPEASVAHAFAKKVFPVPGGPYNKIPFQGILAPVNKSGNLMGKITASWMAFLAFTKPAISVHLTLGFSVTMASDNAYSNLDFSLSSLLSAEPPPLPPPSPPPPLPFLFIFYNIFSFLFFFTL